MEVPGSGEVNREGRQAGGLNLSDVWIPMPYEEEAAQSVFGAYSTVVPPFIRERPVVFTLCILLLQYRIGAKLHCVYLGVMAVLYILHVFVEIRFSPSKVTHWRLYAILKSKMWSLLRATIDLLKNNKVWLCLILHYLALAVWGKTVVWIEFMWIMALLFVRLWYG